MTQLSSACKLSIAEAGARISDKSFTSAGLTQMMLDRIATIEPKLLSYVTVLRDDALKAARAADKEIPIGEYRRSGSTAFRSRSRRKASRYC